MLQELIFFTRSTLPKTNIAPENRPGPKRKRSHSNHPFSGAMLVSERVVLDFTSEMIPPGNSKAQLDTSRIQIQTIKGIHLKLGITWGLSQMTWYPRAPS